MIMFIIGWITLGIIGEALSCNYFRRAYPSSPDTKGEKVVTLLLCFLGAITLGADLFFVIWGRQKDGIPLGLDFSFLLYKERKE